MFSTVNGFIYVLISWNVFRDSVHPSLAAISGSFEWLCPYSITTVDMIIKSCNGNHVAKEWLRIKCFLSLFSSKYHTSNCWVDWGKEIQEWDYTLSSTQTKAILKEAYWMKHFPHSSVGCLEFSPFHVDDPYPSSKTLASSFGLVVLPSSSRPALSTSLGFFIAFLPRFVSVLALVWSLILFGSLWGCLDA